jgi:hypothetical protein
MPSRLEDRDCDILLRRIRDGKCTPFLGAGVNAGVLPLGSDIARQWAAQYKYPLEDGTDLARVAQFLAVSSRDKMFPKEEIVKSFEGVAPPDFSARDDPQGALADLPLPVYMSTNYDDFMAKALQSRGKDPKTEYCRWNSLLRKEPSVFDPPTAFRPTPANPIVFHMHGHQTRAESLVLTEDDYLDFLVNISRDQNLLPARIQEALTGASLLFVGYRLADWDFRVIFRGLVTAMESSLRRISVAVQLPPPEEGVDIGAQKYLTEYFEDIHVRVYWGTAREFVVELRDRWEKFRK